MKEIKDFIKELNDCAILSDGGPVVSVMMQLELYLGHLLLV